MLESYKNVNKREIVIAELDNVRLVNGYHDYMNLVRSFNSIKKTNDFVQEDTMWLEYVDHVTEVRDTLREEIKKRKIVMKNYL